MATSSADKQTSKLIKLFEKRRKELGLSHQTLADQTGLARSTISYVLNQKSVPTITVCLKIAKALDVEIKFNHTD